MQHLFDISIATKYGVNEAIFLNNIAFWVAHNKANNRHFYEDKYWTYNSVKAFLELFPYWTTRNLRTIIDGCINQDLLIKGNFNKISYDKTGWYTLSDQGLTFFPALSIFQKRQMSNDAGCEGEKALEPAPLLICQKRQMELSETTNGVVRNDKPIPDKNSSFKHIKSSYAFRSKNEQSQEKAKTQKIENEKKHEWADKPKNIQRSTELKQCAKFWEPGNPDYDRVNN